MIKRTYNNGYKIKYYPALAWEFYIYLLINSTDKMKGGLKE